MSEIIIDQNHHIREQDDEVMRQIKLALAVMMKVGEGEKSIDIV